MSSTPSPEGREIPTEEHVRSLLTERTNWGRWGEDDQRGALNLITDTKRTQAAGLVRTGQVASLSEPIIPNQSDRPGAPISVVQQTERGGGAGGCSDHFSVSYHGYDITHIDALCHVWLDAKMWNGRDPHTEVQPDGVRWGGIDQWSQGILTRGVLVDVPGHRGERYVTADRPVHGFELEQILAERGTTVEPGDALLVHSGRAAWNEENPTWGTVGPRSSDPNAEGQRPGLHASCMEFLRDSDISVLFWDMLDLAPTGYSLPWSVHLAIASFGIALVDNTSFKEVLPLARTLDQWEFMVTVNPLRVVGGTGSPVNPVAVF